MNFNTTFDFYDSSSIKLYNLDQTMKYQLSTLDRLDAITKRHSENVGNLTGRICKYLRLNRKFIIHATICGYLHDIGKIGIPRSILEKPGALTDEEYDIMKKHTTIGYNICHDDLKLRPYEDGPLYHHEALNGTGYPQGLTSKDIPLVAKIVRVADEYDAIVIKRHYTTHVHISETLKELIKDSKPEISPKILKALFKVVIDDTLYEISCVVDYLNYLKEQIKRLDQIKKYNEKLQHTDREKKKEYYRQGIKCLLQDGENFDNFDEIYKEYKDALVIRQERVNDLYKEIKIIKRLRP